ncbi:unnamed protein product, partial [Meganyctiphanes norvegica]
DRNNFLSKQFSDVESFLMPKPGDCVDNSKFNGCRRELRREFMDEMEALSKHLLHPNQLEQNLKKFSGKSITASRFCDYFEECANRLGDVNWEHSINIFEAFLHINCDTATKDALKIYDDEMNQKIKSIKDEEELHRIDKDARVIANNEYKDKCALTRKNALEVYEERMENMNQ